MNSRTVKSRTPKGKVSKEHILGNRTFLEEVEILGETLTPGREFKIESTRSRSIFVFKQLVVPEVGEPWVDAVEKGQVAARSFHLHRIAKVIPLPKTRRKASDVTDAP